MRIIAAAAAGALVITGLTVTPAQAHAEVSLPGSDFEIEDPVSPGGANLKVDDAAPSLDWMNVEQEKTADVTDPKNDNSFGQGAKEDTEVPTVVTGGIPPNKSDLKNFGLYLETNLSGHQYLNLYWHRVQDPTGTTNMDFEFNQSEILSANGFTPVRTHGDMLIQYDLANGGTRPELSVSRWLTSFGPTPLNACQAGSLPCWSTKVNFSALGLATGSINTGAIPAGESDGLGAISARTFGEATVDFTALASTLDECQTFGSAYLKSRSSDSFTAALKDFIAPIGTGFPTCGNVTIRKVTDPTGSTEDFEYTKDFTSDPADSTFTLSDGESQSFSEVPIDTEGHVTESTLPPGWDLDHVDCEASTDGANVTIDGAEITFNLDTAADTVDCTYYNRARGTITVEKITDSGQGEFEFTSSTLTPSPFTLETTGAGAAGMDSEAFENLPPGNYDVAETAPDNWHQVSATCTGDDDGTDPASIVLDAGENVVCTFHNDRDLGAIKIVKTRKHVASNLPNGPTDHPHAGVTFTVTGGELPPGGVPAVTGADGTVCVPGLLVSAFADDYTVTESVPAGYHLVGPNGRTATVVESEGDCDPITPAATVSFQNMPLTNLTVSVDSQVDGGTKSTIDCVPGLPEPDQTTGPNGDGSLTLNNLEPQVVTCTIVIDP
ncbi:hypothetical protein ASE14_07040 [Agromyces sp. Root81]|uniref:MSCRAMM family protein n=1 Tax=Agromyces sp. Root81 TaxID=1736601 RepID=UPI0006FDC376|nr:hypothetical protein [Agromyces sp. Root81]KRC60728.1 hypothetical protein ASE14_07040 [Agromyces sp. Root81]